MILLKIKINYSEDIVKNLYSNDIANYNTDKIMEHSLLGDIKIRYNFFPNITMFLYENDNSKLVINKFSDKNIDIIHLEIIFILESLLELNDEWNELYDFEFYLYSGIIIKDILYERITKKFFYETLCKIIKTLSKSDYIYIIPHKEAKDLTVKSLRYLIKAIDVDFFYKTRKELFVKFLKYSL